ncbi:type I secretion system permease/ATPase [Chitinibacteraceae bacterium HSL-7]
MSAQAHWQLPPEVVSGSDALTSCLVVLTHFFHQPMAANTLLQGLPLQDGRLTPDLFGRAAERAGLSAQQRSRPLDQISPLTLPAVLLLKGGHYAVALKREGSRWHVIDPDTGSGVREVDEATLASIYSGEVLFVKPAFRLDQRVTREQLASRLGWFTSTLKLARPLYGYVLLASLLINTFALTLPLFVMNVYDRVVPNQAFPTLWVLTSGVAVVLLFDVLIRGLRAYFIDAAGKQIDVQLSALTFEHVLDLQTAARPDSVGGLVSRFQDFEAFRDFVTSATLTTLVDLPFTLLFVGIIFWVGGPIALVPLIAMPLIVGAALLLHWPLRQLVQQTFAVSAQKHAMLIETMSGIETVKSIGGENALQFRWEQLAGELARLSVKTRALSSAIVSQATFFQQLAYVTLVVWGVYEIAARNMTVGGLIASTMLINRALAPLAQIAALISRSFQAKASVQGMDTLMQLPIERPAGRQFVHRTRFQGAIEFRDVSFAYPGVDVPVLRNVSFKISAGERVAIIGHIGSGKSTLEKLILGFYPPQSGSVWVDGLDQGQIDPAELRHHIGYVAQDVCLFYGSVRDNIVQGAPYVDDATMLRAAELAGVNDFVNAHPQGFAMPVGERGTLLSGGQRQSVALARATLLDPPIFVLDEPTNSLDNRAEQGLIQRLGPVLQGKTVVLVTHRASLLALVDRLIVMEKGRIVADGPKATVLEALASGRIHGLG